jgi:hypothetical protein
MRFVTTLTSLATPSSGSSISIKWKSPAAQRPLGHPTPIDEVRVHDDPALGGLPEHHGRTRHRHGSGGDDVGQHLTRPDRGKLVDVADEQQPGMVQHGLGQGVHQRHVKHRGLVHHEQVLLVP